MLRPRVGWRVGCREKVEVGRHWTTKAQKNGDKYLVCIPKNRDKPIRRF